MRRDIRARVKLKRACAMVLAAAMAAGVSPKLTVNAAGNNMVFEAEGAELGDVNADTNILQEIIAKAMEFYMTIKDNEAFKTVAENLKKAIDNAKAIINSGSITPDMIAKAIAEITKKMDEAWDKAKEEAKKKADEAWDTAKEEAKKKAEDIKKKAEEAKAAIEKKAKEAEEDIKKKIEEEIEKAKKAWEESKEKAAAKKRSSEWIDGKWYNADGSQTYADTGSWKSDSTGWWFEDTSGWYPKNEWQKIDGKWYFFCADGYMDYSEYRDGYWLGADGAWIEVYKGGHWMCDSTGWWYVDEYGWYPKSESLWIDGVCYSFGADGYLK